MGIYYVYRFKDVSGRIVYVGKTKNINNRMYNHFSGSGHLTQQQYSSVAVVEYIKLGNKIEMDIKELYYINKLKPIFNKVNSRYDEAPINLGESDVWEVYFDNRINSVTTILKSKVTRLEKENSELRRAVKAFQQGDEEVKIQTRKKRSDSRKTVKCVMNQEEYTLFKKLQRKIRAEGKNGGLTDLALATKCIETVFNSEYDMIVIDYVKSRDKKDPDRKQVNARIPVERYDEMVAFNPVRISNQLNIREFVLASILQYARQSVMYFEIENFINENFEEGSIKVLV